MTSDSGEGVWYEGDHIQGGFVVLERLQHPRFGVRAASAGYSNDGMPQVLVLGGSNVEILTGEGDLLLDVGCREVRAVRLVEKAGVQVCVTSMGDGGLRQTRWLHRVSDADARYLEECWLSNFPMMHNGTQLNPLPWREEEYAYYVGRVLTESARCDVALTALVLSARNVLGQSGESIVGASGEPLADALDDIGRLSLAFQDIGERYRAWYRRRNFAAHGIRDRDAAGHPTGHVFKVRKGKKGQTPEVVVDIQDQDFRDLALLWRAFYALNHDAFQATVYIGARGTPEDILATIPMSESVNTSDRLPPNAQSAGNIA